MNRTALRCSVPGILVAIAVLGPFLGKAFTIDDTVFLREAQHALSDPLHPTAFTMVWGEVADRVAPTSGPVMAWLLLPSVAAGGAEWIAHLTQLIMLSLAVLATVALALRLGVPPAWATAAGVLLAATPAALGMAGTAMADVPAMAFGVAGLERLVAWRHERRAIQAAAAALLLGIAPHARPHLVLLVGVGALLLVGDFLRIAAWRSLGWKPWAPVVAAPVVTVAIALALRDTDPRALAVMGVPKQLTGLAHVMPNVVAFATHWVLVIPLAAGWGLVRIGAMARRWWLFLLVTVLLAIIARIQAVPLFAVILAALGITVILDIAADAWARRDTVQLALWVWLLVPLAPAPYTHLPSKYLLAAAPAAALLVARAMSTRPGRAARVVLAGTAIAGVALGVAILRADAAFAGLGRRAVAELISPNVAAGHRVWFTPHWGFQWYAEKTGARPVTLTPPFPSGGDLLVTSQNSEDSFGVMSMLGRYARVSHVARIEEREPGGRLMSHTLGAGFFSNEWGYLPWVWSDEVLDTFDLWQLE